MCCFSPQKGLPDTQAKFHILFLFFSASMFSVSLAALFIYHCWLVCKNRSTLGRILCACTRALRLKLYLNIERLWLLPVCSQSSLHQRRVMFQCFFFSFFLFRPTAGHRPRRHRDLMSLSGPPSVRTVSHYERTVAHFVCVRWGEWIIQRSMLQCNAKTQSSEQ